MNRWDHFDVIIAVGVCATILGASMFFFAFGGAPTGLLDQRFESAAPAAIDPGGVTQAALGQAIVESGAISHLEGAPWGFTQGRLGGAIVTAVRAEQARAGLMSSFRDEARESLYRMQGMIQEKAGRSVVRAARHMWRDGTTESAQLQFIEMLGRTKAGMILSERAAVPLREEFLGWTVVGRLLAMNGYRADSQQQLGSAVRDAGIMAAMLETERPAVQESMGAAVLVAARASASSEGASPVLVASAGGFSGAREVPYQAGVILFAAVFVMAWGLRSVAETGPGMSASTQAPARSADDRYRKAG
jgi:hypothetical protein